jgi:Tol biopolymer transport system component
MSHPTSEEILDHLLGSGPGLDAHLDCCADCRAALDAWRETEAALGNFYEVRRPAPAGLADRLVGRLRSARPTRVFTLGRMLPVAAALLFCVAVLWRISSMPRSPADARKGADWIAFIEETPRKGDRHQVWLMNPLTGERRQVTTQFGRYSSPTFSPDGRRLAFSSGSGVAVSSTEAPAPRLLALPSDEYSYLQFSPDGSLLLCGTEVFVWLVELPGGGARRLLGDGVRIRKAAFSPDGTRLLYLTSRTPEGATLLASMDLEGKNRKTLFQAGGLDFANVSRDLVVIPDGKRIVFTRQTRTSSFTLAVANLDGTGMRELDRIECSEYIASPDPVLSPDGTRVVYFSAPTRSLWVVELESGTKRELTSGRIAAETGRSAFSPDSLRVGFVANPNQEAEAWLIDLDGGNLRRLGRVAWESRIAWGAIRP